MTLTLNDDTCPELRHDQINPSSSSGILKQQTCMMHGEAILVTILSDVNLSFCWFMLQLSMPRLTDDTMNI